MALPRYQHLLRAVECQNFPEWNLAGLSAHLWGQSTKHPIVRCIIMVRTWVLLMPKKQGRNFGFELVPWKCGTIVATPDRHWMPFLWDFNCERRFENSFYFILPVEWMTVARDGFLIIQAYLGYKTSFFPIFWFWSKISDDRSIFRLFSLLAYSLYTQRERERIFQKIK